MSSPLVSFVVAALLSSVFLLPVGHLPERGKGRRRLLSAAAGGSIAYIFVKLLPEIETAGMVLREEAKHFLPFQGVYGVNLAMMLGFLFFYALDEILPAREEPVRVDPGKLALWTQTAGYGGYVALVGYLLVNSISGTDEISVFYALSMCLHFSLIAFALKDVHGESFDRIDRFCLAGACMAGWALGSLFDLPRLVVIGLFGFVCGGVVSITGIVELPKGEEGRIVPLAAGALGYATLLILFS
jgi:hypothetical protein